MLKPSPETEAIRQIVGKFSDEDLLSKGPKDLKGAVEAAGLDYESVREKVNNELARARRNRGIRKGRGRRVAAPGAPEPARDEDQLAQVRLFIRLDEIRKRFDSWAEARIFIKEIAFFIEGFGSLDGLMDAIQIKEDYELDLLEKQAKVGNARPTRPDR